ncbi:MAG: methylenetetrahydrofolate reductase [Desulfobacterales bacterium]|nr:methylenetetrahydrofolate reductase [Desulfobacterales bacterium]
MPLKKRFKTGQFAILAEMDPPKGVDVSAMVKHASRVKGEVDAFIVPEMNSAVMRMSALGGAMVLQSKGMETVMQVNCRDRNRIAIQADLLAAGALGIPGIMAVSGEEPRFGDHPEAKAVYDLDLMTLIQAAVGLNRGKDMAGIELAGSTEFMVGSTVDPGVDEGRMEEEIATLTAKAEAGVDFFVAPALFDPAAVKAFTDRIDTTRFRILPTVLLLKSVGMARYVDRNFKNIYVPPDMISRIQKAGDRAQECVRIATETIRALKKAGFAGAVISTIGWEDKLPEILSKI